MTTSAILFIAARTVVTLPVILVAISVGKTVAGSTAMIRFRMIFTPTSLGSKISRARRIPLAQQAEATLASCVMPAKASLRGFQISSTNKLIAARKTAKAVAAGAGAGQ